MDEKKLVLNVVLVGKEVELFESAFNASGLRAKADFIRMLISTYWGDKTHWGDRKNGY